MKNVNFGSESQSPPCTDELRTSVAPFKSYLSTENQVFSYELVRKEDKDAVMADSATSAVP